MKELSKNEVSRVSGGWGMGIAIAPYPPLSPSGWSQPYLSSDSWSDFSDRWSWFR